MAFINERFGLTACRAFNFGEFIDGKAQQPLPPTITSDEPQISAFADSCHDLCRKILHLLGVGLGVRILPLQLCVS